MKLSIITVCYNEEKMIRTTCESVVNQTFQEFEWVIIDGGSTDKTLEILDEYRGRINVFVSEKDDGIYDAMNKGIEESSGEYLLFLNGGDSLYYNDALKDVFQGEKEYSEDLIYGHTNIVRLGGASVVRKYNKELTKRFLVNFSLGHQSTFIKKELFAKYGNYDLSYKSASDYDKFLQFILAENCSYCLIDKTIATFNFFGGISSSNSNIGAFEVREIRRKYFTLNERLKYLGPGHLEWDDKTHSTNYGRIREIFVMVLVKIKRSIEERIM